MRFLLCFKKRFCCSTLIYQTFNWKQIQAIWYVPWCYNYFHPYQGLDQSNFFSFNQGKVFFFSIYLIPTYKNGSTRKKKQCYNWFTIFYMLIKEQLSPIAFFTEWISIGLKNVWLLLFIVDNISSKLSKITLRFQHSSSIFSSLGKSPNLPLPSSSSTTLTNFFLEGCLLIQWKLYLIWKLK